MSTSTYIRIDNDAATAPPPTRLAPRSIRRETVRRSVAGRQLLGPRALDALVTISRLRACESRPSDRGSLGQPLRTQPRRAAMRQLTPGAVGSDHGKGTQS